MDGEDVIEAKQLAVSDEAARPARDDAFWETTASSVRAFSADAAEPSRPSATSGAPDPSPGPPAASVPATLPPATLPDGLSSAEGGTASSVPSAEESGAGSSGAGDSSAWAAGCPSEGTAGAGTSPTAASPTSPDAAQAAARRQGQRERAAQKQRQQGTQNVRPVPPGTCERRTDGHRNLSFQGLTRWMGAPTLPWRPARMPARFSRPSAFTVTGIAQDSHPHSPRQARSARPPVPPPTQPSLPFVDQV